MLKAAYADHKICLGGAISAQAITTWPTLSAPKPDVYSAEVPLPHGSDASENGTESQPDLPPASDPRGGIPDTPDRSERLPAATEGRDAASTEPADAATQIPLPGVDHVVTVRQLQALIEHVERSWSGPLPDPADLRAFEEILPGSAERILRSMEVQIHDASARDDRIVDAQIKEGNRGQKWAIALALICIAAAIVFFALGNAVAGGFFLSPPLLLLIGSLLPRRPQIPNPSSDNESAD
jgi:uncharacterized membrane protein